MATVSAIEKVVKVTLEMSLGEAEMLKFVLGKIGGSEKTGRVMTDNMWRELNRCGIRDIRPSYNVSYNHNPTCDAVILLQEEK